MANTVTDLGNRAIKCLGRGAVLDKKVAIDTTGNDVTVVTGVANKQTAWVGGSSDKASADTVLTFTSGSTVIGKYLVANGKCLQEAINSDIIAGICSKTGDDLKIQTDVALNMYLQFVQGVSLEVMLPA